MLARKIPQNLPVSGPKHFSALKHNSNYKYHLLQHSNYIFTQRVSHDSQRKQLISLNNIHPLVFVIHLLHFL
jgi:hypothetical protein